jgi:uncharacterized membrane protein YeaQ/YmgE (transglycosylase-associated protein family)
MSSRPRALGQAVVVVLLVVLVGALAGLVWQWLWDPPRGVVMNHRWVQDEVGLRGDFAGTGTYVAVATVAGLLAGLGVALSSRRHELVTLVALVVGSLLAGWVMYRVGVALAPPSPDLLARTAREGARLPGTLRVSGASPFLALPAGSLLGLIVVFVGLSRRRDRHPQVTVAR